jgi:tetratricopeptide (TPR) repeat protein
VKKYIITLLALGTFIYGNNGEYYFNLGEKEMPPKIIYDGQSINDDDIQIKYNNALKYFKLAEENGYNSPFLFENLAEIYANGDNPKLAFGSIEKFNKINKSYGLDDCNINRSYAQARAKMAMQEDSSYNGLVKMYKEAVVNFNKAKSCGGSEIIKKITKTYNVMVKQYKDLQKRDMQTKIIKSKNRYIASWGSTDYSDSQYSWRKLTIKLNTGDYIWASLGKSGSCDNLLTSIGNATRCGGSTWQYSCIGGGQKTSAYNDSAQDVVEKLVQECN